MIQYICFRSAARNQQRGFSDLPAGHHRSSDEMFHRSWHYVQRIVLADQGRTVAGVALQQESCTLYPFSKAHTLQGLPNNNE